LSPETLPNHFNALDPDINSIIGDIRDKDKLSKIVKDVAPEIVFHLAAQPIVRKSYKDPVMTYETNVIGTLNLYEAIRQVDSVNAVITITTDKVYENREWYWGYRENDPLGGYDPYSSSKACCDIMSASYRNSFFNIKEYGKKHNVLLATARAGNVIGGGDWAEDRLIPDIMKAASQLEPVIIRSPYSIRPWQHVLESLSGYLLLGQKLLEGKPEFAESWNFGPSTEGSISVSEVIGYIKKYWSALNYKIISDEKNPHEAKYLKLDCSKALSKLGWQPVLTIDETFEITTRWYKEFYTNESMLSIENIEYYLKIATDKNLSWTTLNAE